MKSLLKKLDEIIRLLNKLLENKEAENENKDNKSNDFDKVPKITDAYMQPSEQPCFGFTGKYFKHNSGSLFKVIEDYGGTYKIIKHFIYDDFEETKNIDLMIGDEIVDRNYISESNMISNDEFQNLCYKDILTYQMRMMSI